jgi:hypothetical protein
LIRERGTCGSGKPTATRSKTKILIEKALLLGGKEKKRTTNRTNRANHKHKESNYSKIAYALKSPQPTKEVDHKHTKINFDCCNRINFDCCDPFFFLDPN